MQKCMEVVPAACSTPQGASAAPLKAGVVLSARVPQTLLGCLGGCGCGPKTPTAGAGGSWFIAVPGPEEVDVLDAADELAQVAEPDRLQAIAEAILSIAQGVLGLHDLHVELYLHEEAQLHAEALVQVAAKRKEGVHHDHLPLQRTKGVLAEPVRLIANADGLPHRHARHSFQHNGCHGD